MENIDEVRKRYEERKQREQECYNTYYKIAQDYEHTLHLDFSTRKPDTPTYSNGISQSLTYFTGRVIKRKKAAKHRYESKFIEYWRYKVIALQDTVLDAVIDYATTHNMDIWSRKFIEVNLKFYGTGKKSHCIIFNLKEISGNEFGKPSGNSFGNQSGNDLGKESGTLTNKTKTQNENKQEISDKEQALEMDFSKETGMDLEVKQ